MSHAAAPRVRWVGGSIRGVAATDPPDTRYSDADATPGPRDLHPPNRLVRRRTAPASTSEWSCDQGRLHKLK